MNYLQDSFHGDIDFELDQFSADTQGGQDEQCKFSKLKISTITLHGEFTKHLNLQILYEILSKKLNVNYDPKNKKSKTKKKKGEQTAAAMGGGEKKNVKEAKLDPVGKEDGDVDNDGDKDKTDDYLMNRRKAVGKAIAKKKGKKERKAVENDEALAQRKGKKAKHNAEAAALAQKKGKKGTVTLIKS